MSDTTMPETANEEVSNEETEERTYTKDDIERIVKQRLSKFEDYDAIKTERDELLSAKSEFESQVQAAQDSFNAFKAGVTKRIVDAEAKAMAASMQFIYPDDAALYINEADALDDEGNVSTEKISESLTKLVEERPALVRGNSKTSGADIGLGTTGTPKPKSNGQLFADALKSAF